MIFDFVFGWFIEINDLLDYWARCKFKERESNDI